jgi:hypothetical protein
MRIFILLLTTLSFTFSFHAQTGSKGINDRPNFSGDWILNVTESKYDSPSSNQLIAADAGVITRIVHNEPEFRITLINSASGAVKSEFPYFTDGREVQIPTRAGLEKSKTKWDGDKLVTKGKLLQGKPPPPPKLEKGQKIAGHGTFDDPEIKTEWFLSPDGQKLTEKLQITSRLRMTMMGQESVHETKSLFVKVYDKGK